MNKKDLKSILDVNYWIKMFISSDKFYIFAAQIVGQLK